MTLWLHHLCLAGPSRDVDRAIRVGADRLERWAWENDDGIGITLGLASPEQVMRSIGAPDLWGAT